MLKDAGFEDVIAEDRTDQVTLPTYFCIMSADSNVNHFIFSQFVQVLRRELEKVEKEKEEFISDFSEVKNISH